MSTNRLLDVARLLLREASGLVAPPLCVGCDAETRRVADALCSCCAASLELLPRALCTRCAQPTPCGGCNGTGVVWESAHAVCRHEGTAGALVRSLKQTGARRVATAMASTAVGRLPGGLWESSAIVPVAPHPARRRVSGVDHAAVLAVAIAGIVGRPVVKPLLRAGRPHRQAGASLDERTAEGRVRFDHRGPVPKRAVLLDDVWTSGATLSAAAKCLADAGCESIVALAWSRALLDSPSVRRPADW